MGCTSSQHPLPRPYLSPSSPPPPPPFPTPHPHNSYGVVKTYCGHGIGELFHCAPNVPHYAHNKAKGIMKAGEVFTIGGWVGWGGAWVG